MAAASNGWDESAEAWIADIGDQGDWGRRHVLDPAFRERLAARRFMRALDVGCGEGRLCRRLAAMDVAVIGLDPTRRLIEEARAKDPTGEYVLGLAEELPFPDRSFDLVLCCLALIDIPGYAAAIAEMHRVLAPGGTLLIANLTSHTTARHEDGWQRAAAGEPLFFKIDGYLEPRSRWESYRGITILNWHRPLSAYMTEFLRHDLRLTFFDEPSPVGADPARAARYRRAPWFVVMEWQKV